MEKRYLFALPEIILAGLSVYWFLDNYLGAQHFNPIAFAVFLILALQVFFRNKYVGFILAWLISLFALYMVLAVISEFKDFPTVNSAALQLLGFGLLLCSLMFGSAILMFYKYFPKVF